jgi:hypothetical protein
MRLLKKLKKVRTLLVRLVNIYKWGACVNSVSRRKSDIAKNNFDKKRANRE